MAEQTKLTQPELAAEQMLWERQRYRPDPVLAQRAREEAKRERERKFAEWFWGREAAEKRGEPPPAG